MRLTPKLKLLFIVNVDWFFVSHRLHIALEALAQGYEVHIATAITDQKYLLESSGMVVHPISLNRSGQSLGDAWRTCREIFSLYRRIKPDVVHLITIKPVLLGGLMARLAAVPAVVAAVPGLGFVFLDSGFKAVCRRWLVTRLYAAVFKHPNLTIIFQNGSDFSLMQISTGVDRAKLTIVPGSGVDMSRYMVTPLSSGKPVVALVSRMLVDKGVREFVSAVKILNQQGVVARFCLVGTVDPSNPSSLTQSELDIWAKQDGVELWGHRTDMPQVMATTTIVVLPSYREGLPKVLIEAAACGRAVITTDVPGCRDAILPDQTGLLVPVRDAAALAKAIAELISDPQRCAAMGLAGRQLAESIFDVKSVVQRHLTIYQELLASVQAKAQAKAQEVET